MKRYMYILTGHLELEPLLEFSSVQAVGSHIAYKSPKNGTLLAPCVSSCIYTHVVLCHHLFLSQLIYDFKDGGGSFGLLSLHPEHLPDKDKAKFEKIRVKIPSMMYVE